ncbi:MAG: hypothetical protein A2Z27_05360 [candidate division Zixibacteria bacterium RBG_16_50_21]|nr:MAG: hypothetical protein A2Z27_05360 [candidate division Zixibacteria bacterium RBG_16_50_21]
MRTDFNPHLHKIEISPIVTISEQAKSIAPEYEQRTGRPFLYFQRGEIDLPVIDEIREETIRSLNQGKTKYPVSGGSKEVKLSLLEKLREYNQIEDLSPENIVLTYGGQEALQVAFELLRGGRGAGFSPIWSVIIENFIPYSGLDFVEVPLRDDFSIDFDLLEKVLSSGLDFFYLNNPHNPTGKVFSPQELVKIGELCRKNSLLIIADEAYEYILYDDKKHISVASLPELRDYPDIISAFTYSKTFSMTGFRAGYAVTKNKVAAELMKRVQYTQTAGVVSFIQPALRVGTRLNHKIAQRVAEFQKRRDLLLDGLNMLENLTVPKPQGALYIFPDFSGLIPKSQSHNNNYIYELLLNHGICVVPGKDFTKTRNFDSSVRFSFSATPLEQIKEGVRRLQEIFLSIF